MAVAMQVVGWFCLLWGSAGWIMAAIDGYLFGGLPVDDRRPTTAALWFIAAGVFLR